MSSPGFGPLAGRRLAGVAEHLDHRGVPLVGRCHRVVGRVHQLGELVQSLAVGTRDAHQLGDQPRRQATGDVAHEVALASVDDVVDDLARQLLDAVAQQLRVLRREPPADEQLEAVVLRRVHVQHHLARGHERSSSGSPIIMPRSSS